jgi:hypothetical protein
MRRTINAGKYYIVSSFLRRAEWYSFGHIKVSGARVSAGTRQAGRPSIGFGLNSQNTNVTFSKYHAPKDAGI